MNHHIHELIRIHQENQERIWEMSISIAQMGGSEALRMQQESQDRIREMSISIAQMGGSEALRMQQESQDRIREMSISVAQMDASQIAQKWYEYQERSRKVMRSALEISNPLNASYLSGFSAMIEANPKALEGINKSLPRTEMSLDHPSMDLHSKLIAPPQTNPEPGNAAKVLNAVNEELQIKEGEHAGNPRKVVAMIATLSAGEKIYVQQVRNTGDETIEITGRNIHNGKEQKVWAGVSNVTLEVLVSDRGPQKPDLKLV